MCLRMNRVKGERLACFFCVFFNCFNSCLTYSEMLFTIQALDLLEKSLLLSKGHGDVRKRY